MRNRESKNGLTVNVIAGTYVVYLGFDLTTQARKNGCLGFAIHRTDETEDEAYWLEGMKTFAETDPGLAPGARVSTDRHPIQSFQWGDYTAKPEHNYVYRIVPIYGTPAAPKKGAAVEVAISTEKEMDGTHSIFFNRGAVSSQEYARRFSNRPPNEVGTPAYEWLSRGLIEAFSAFVARAKDQTYGIHAAIYEFQWPDAIEVFAQAARNKAKVQIIYDGIVGDSKPKKQNEKAIVAAKVKGICIAKTEGTLMHNKFVVLTKNGKPLAVWTGSTNLTVNGIYGHSNCGHIIEDANVAASYLAYWNELKKDVPSKEMRRWIDTNNDAPAAHNDCEPVFSPRSGLDVLDWYAGIAASAQRALFMTFAFGMADQFKEVYETADDVLRLALMEKEGNGASLEQGKIDIRRIRKRTNVVIAVARNLLLNKYDRWLKERRSLSHENNVKWIHTKYMLVDPLGNDPIVVTGSANFSKASTNKNDENMVVIRGDKRAADIYFTEYMRLFAGYAFRNAAAIAREKSDGWVPKPLAPSDEWLKRYYQGGQDELRRIYFSGS
jgi:phosphatidylserine/phosphatidylglycerophosphate/cardiolipin synthase-like enzyme